MTEAGEGRGARAALTVLTVTVGLQCLRVVFPVAYSYREGNGVPRTVAAVAIVFLAPALAPVLVQRVARAIVLLGVVGALVAARLTLQTVGSVGIGLAVVAAAVGLLAINVVLTPTVDGRAAALGLLGGLALDTAIRAAWGTWDLSWQRGSGAVVATAVLLALLVGAAVFAARGSEDSRAFDRTWLGLAIGPYLALEVIFLQSLGAVAAAGGLALATATAVVLVGDGFAALTVEGVAGSAVGKAALRIFAGATIIVAWLLPRATGTAIVVLVVGGQVVASTLLARAASSPSGAPRLGRSVAATAVGGLVFGTTLFLYQLHYDKPLPVSNRWLLVVAAAVLGGAALGTASVAESRRMWDARRLLVAGALALAGFVVVADVAAAEPDLSSSVDTVETLRVVTFNVHNAVTRDGSIDPETIARTVERLDPDVLVIEEAGRGWLLSSTFDLGEWLKRRLDLPYRWAPAADEQMGNLLFSRVPIRDARVVDLPQGSGSMRRSALIARVGPVGGSDVTIAGVHLQNGSSAAAKSTRIAETNVLLHALGDTPRTVIAGDLNMDPAERDLRHLLAAGFSTTQPSTECALKTSNDNCVDWILVSDDLEQGRPRVVPVRHFDHNPVSTTVRPA